LNKGDSLFFLTVTEFVAEDYIDGIRPERRIPKGCASSCHDSGAGSVAPPDFASCAAALTDLVAL
jgi:hypothetical protein